MINPPNVKIDREWLMQTLGGEFRTMERPAEEVEGFGSVVAAPHRFGSVERLQQYLAKRREQGATIFLFEGAMRWLSDRWEIWIRMAAKIPKESTLTHV